MIKPIIAKLKSLLEANSQLQKVYDYERSDPTGTPFATITPAANENNYFTTTENERMYAFLIRLFVERKGQGSEENSEAAMRELLDSVLDTLDRNYTLSGLGTKAGYTFINMRAAPSVWGYTGRENQYRVAEINVQCRVSVDVTLI